MVDADEPNAEPVDQGQEDFNTAMQMAACDLIEVACAYMRRLRADAAWDAADATGDKAGKRVAYDAMFEADMDARDALGLDDVCADCAARDSSKDGVVPDGFREVLG